MLRLRIIFCISDSADEDDEDDEEENLALPKKRKQN
jgi:hypothetical protein